MNKATERFIKFAYGCPYRIEPELLRRPCNGLNVEIGQPADRCSLKLPEHWPQAAKDLGGTRWVLSGGSPLVFGHCSRACALGVTFCEWCGHSKDSHLILGTRCYVENCDCEVFK